MNQENLTLLWTLLPIELWNTVYMVFVAAFISICFGLPLGIILTITEKNHLKENLWLNHLLSAIVNIGRSFPFAILIVALIPVTRFFIGTSLGTTASIIPLSIAAIPFLARLVEASLKEVDKGVIEAALVMGSSPWQIIRKVLLPESTPSLIAAITTTIINLIGYSAMAGTMGGGGLGKIAIQYGYQRFNPTLMIVTVLLLIILVQGIQMVGNQYTAYLNRQRGKKE